MSSFNTPSSSPKSFRAGRTGSGFKVCRGFTLVELLVTVSLCSVLMAFAAPSVAGFRDTMQLKSVSESFVSSLHFARNQAILRNTRVVLCKSADGTSCAVDGGWEQGWIVFVDPDNSKTLNTGDKVLLRQPSMPGVKVTGNSNVATNVSYTGVGTTTQAGRVTVCNLSTSSVAQRDIVINMAGRFRVQASGPAACVLG